MRTSTLALTVIIATVYILVGYFSLSTHVSWAGRGEFNHLENVSSSSRVTVDVPLELELISDLYPELGSDMFEDSLKRAIEDVMTSKNLQAEFSHVRPVVVFPNEETPGRIGNPIIIVFTNFQGHEDKFYYEICYASVLLYMNSNGDIGSYLNVERKYSDDSRKTDDLSNFALDLYNEALSAEENGNYSLKIAYWNVLKVRTGKFSGRKCWDVLADEISKEVEEWASTLGSK